MTDTQPTWPAELLAYIDGIRERFGDAARVEADDYLKVGLTKKWGPQRADAQQLAEAARALLEACYAADAEGDLGPQVDGSLMDAVAAALSQGGQAARSDDDAMDHASAPGA